ncbi:MAG: diguanylate cyclase [Vicinamibacteraceae bacterium]|nr:diguanylate cyclase [Vicinamibacteraceae bacterium]
MRSWEDELQELTAEFLAGGPARVSALQAATDRLAALPHDLPALAELRRLFHSLAGAGATYGVERLSTLAREGEALCLEVAEGETRPPQAIDEWRRLVREIAAAFVEAASRTGGAPAPGFATPGGPVTALVSPADGRKAHGSRPFFDIVVVDPDETVGRRVARLMAHDGVRIRNAASAAEARRAFDEAIPDGVLVDLQLPDGPGYGVIEDLRSRPGGDEPAVVIVSLTGDFLDQAEAIHAGADACFDTPVDWDEVAHKLSHLLERSVADVPRVLIVEDDPANAVYARTILEAVGYEVRVCDRPRHFNETLATFRPDLILMDIVLPEFNGFDLTRFVRQDNQYATLPIIFLTSETEVQARIQTVKAGGDDFLLKPVNPSLLIANVAARLERARFLKTLLNRDGLTRLLTHTSFMEQAQALMAQKRRHDTGPASLVMLDIDHFKTVNDTYGHQAGDRVLQTLSTTLRRHLRRSDVLGRYGGEEFGILLDTLSENEAARLMLRLLDEFGRTDHRAPDGTTFRATFSAGVAELLPSYTDLERWIQAADAALYGAKRTGRNRVLTSQDWVCSLRPATPA